MLTPVTAGLGGLLSAGDSLIGVSVSHPFPPGLTLRLAGLPILGAGVVSPWLPRQAGLKRKGVVVGTLGFP